MGGTGAGVITTGINNTAWGFAALNSNTTGTDNTAVGFKALNLTTGSNNTAIGSEAGSSISTGNNNVMLGEATTLDDNTDSNSIVIGQSAAGLGSNIAVMGNSSITALAPGNDGASLGTGSFNWIFNAPTFTYQVASITSNAATINQGVGVFYIAPGGTTSTIVLTGPSSPSNGQIIIIVNKNVSHAATFDTTNSVSSDSVSQFVFANSTWYPI